MSRVQFVRVFVLSLIANLAWAQSPVLKERAPSLKGNSALVPLAARYKVSALLGQDDSRYRVTGVGNTLNTENSGQGFSAEFQRTGLSVRSGSSHWNLMVQRYGYGSRLRQAGDAAPTSRNNRVEYRRGILTEWYVNGPIGLEQGFTFDKRPGEAQGKSLTLAMALSGDLKASLDPDATGLTLMARDGRKILRYAGLTAFDASGRKLDAWLELRGEQNLLVHVADRDAHYPLTIDPFVQVAKLTASDGGDNFMFGDSVSMTADGTTLVVGSQFAGVGTPNESGEAYVFVKPAGGWSTMTEIARLSPSDQNGRTASFGDSVAVSNDGNTVIVGAWQAREGAGNPGGAGYVFVKPPGGWVTATETAQVLPSNIQTVDAFGMSVSISGDGSTIVVCSPQHSGTGAAYVFLQPSSGWTGTVSESATLTSSNPLAGDQLGTLNGNGVSISADATTIVAGVPHSTGAPALGSALVFTKPSGGWSGNLHETAKLTASDEGTGDSFGIAVAVSSNGSVVLSGAWLNPFNSTTQVGGPGAAYVFVEPSGGWASMTETAKLTASDGVNGDDFGLAVAISNDGTTVGVGAMNNPSTNPSGFNGFGATYVFKEPATGWVTTSISNKLVAGDPHLNDQFGSSVSLSGDGCFVAVGAALNPANIQASQGGPGAVYVFHCLVPTTIGVNSSADPSVFGQAVTFTATVTPSSGSGTPGGSVSFSDGATLLASGIVLAGGQGVFTTSSLSVGPHSISAVYSGDANFLGSTSTALAQTVNPASTTTTLASSLNPSSLNQGVTFTATVSVVSPGSGTPTGTVTFQDGSTVLASGVSLSTAGTAAFSTSSLAIGSHSITAVYSGDGNFNGSTGSLTQKVAYAICVLYDQTKSVQSGAVFPIKLQLCDVNGNDVSSSAVVLHAVAVTMVSGFVGVPESPGNANPDNDFRFDGSQGPTGGYIFNLKTTGLGGGTYALQFTAGADPVLHAVNFGVK